MKLTDQNQTNESTNFPFNYSINRLVIAKLEKKKKKERQYEVNYNYIRGKKDNLK